MLSRLRGLQSFDFFTDRLWIWAGVGGMMAFYVACNILAWAALKFYSGEARKATVGDREDALSSLDMRAVAAAEGEAAIDDEWCCSP
jgi:hypothetical protein